MEPTRSYQAVYPQHIQHNYRDPTTASTIHNLQKVKITIHPTIEVKVNGNKIDISINGSPGISLSSGVVNNDRTIGPFIESISYEITPLANASFEESNTLPEEKVYQQTNTESNQLNLNGVLTLQSPPGAGFSMSKTAIMSCKKTEFELTTHREGDKISWEKKLILCTRRNDETFLPYDPNNVECMRKLNHLGRCILVNFGPDTLRDVPETAKSSITMKTSAIFKRNTGVPSKFKVTVFAQLALFSNNCCRADVENTPRDKLGSYLFWVKVRHEAWIFVHIDTKDSVQTGQFRHSQFSNYGISKRILPKRWETGWEEEDQESNKGSQHAHQFTNSQLAQLRGEEFHPKHLFGKID